MLAREVHNLCHDKKNIDAQIKRTEEILPKIEKEYNNSLHAKNIDEGLKLDIQTFCGHLRSALDYLANDIVEKYCPNAKKGDRLYFPITDSDTSFKQRMIDSYPDLQKNCPDLYLLLESLQPYLKSENKLLNQFNKINNENKHSDLVEQVRTETKRVNVTSPNGGSVSWGSGVTFGTGVSIMGIPVDPRTQLPVPNNVVKTEIITWVDFKFDNVDVSALWLLKESLKQIQDINFQITKFL